MTDDFEMTFNEYQAMALSTALPTVLEPQNGLYYCTLGLNGEAGEVAEKIKKYIRDGVLDAEAVVKEVGDVLWYTAVLAHHLGYTLDDVAQLNVEKLQSRKERTVLQGSGDDR